MAHLSKVRNSKRQKNRLFLWRRRTGKTQDELGMYLGLSRTQVAEYETGKRALLGEGLLIIRWAHFCQLDPGSMDVQDFLYETGNSPLMPDPNCPSCKDALTQCAAGLFTAHRSHQHRYTTFGQRQEHGTTALLPTRVVLTARHPYTGYSATVSP